MYHEQKQQWLPKQIPTPVEVSAPMHLLCYSQHLHCLNQSHQLTHDETLSSYTRDTYASSLSATGQCISGEMLKTKFGHFTAPSELIQFNKSC